MVSPAQIPPVRHRHSFAGPAVLIILGVVFLLATMGILDWGTFGHWFAHYWPLLLILWGILKLMEHQQAQRAGMRSSGIGVGGVFLVLLVIGLGLAATQASRVDWEEFGNHVGWSDDDIFRHTKLFGEVYTYSDEISQAFPPNGSLRVNSERGNINIQDSDDSQIRVVIAKRLHAHNQESGDKYNRSTKPQFTVSGTLVTLNANTLGAGDHGVTTDMTISLPRKASVTISSRRGDVNVTGRDGDSEITSGHGTVSLADIHGKADLTLDQSSARISQVAGDVSIQGHANDVSLEDINGAVRLDGEFMESVKLSKITKPVSFKSPRTDIEFSKLDGDLDLDSGDLQASTLQGPLRLSTRSKDIRLTGVSGDVRLRNEDGAVELHITKLGSMQIENRQGDIKIYMPEAAGFQVDAHARNGEIQSEFNGLNINNGDDQAVATGTVSGGGPHVVLDNEHGTIEIRKATSAQEAAENPRSSTRAPKAPRSPGAPRASTVPEPTEN